MTRTPALSTRDWAMLTYIAGDNNLSEFGLRDIQEMCEVGSSDDLHVAVQIDTEGEFDGVVRYEIAEPDETGVSYRKVIERLPELDSGDPEVFRESVRWGLERYPARKRLLVVWNHGSGFRTPRRDIAYDDAGGSLDMPEVRASLRAAGVSPQAPLDILGFDACLMAMAEVVWSLRDCTRLVVGSQQTEPGEGWPYAGVLSELKATPSAEDAASKIVEAYLADYRERGADAKGVTQSAVRTSTIGGVIDAMGALGRALSASLPASRTAISAARAATQAYDYNDYVDAVDLARLLAKRVTAPAVATASEALRTAVIGAVVASDCEGAAVIDSHGLSVWFPADRSMYFAFRSKYLALGFPPQWGWLTFLDEFHA